MASYLLDTNICGFLFRNKYGIAEKIREVGLSNCAVSQLTVVELMVGFEYSKLKNGIDQSKRLNEFLKYVQVIPIEEIMHMAAFEKARLQLEGTPAHDLIDVLIGCTAIQNNMVMVTENTKHFQNFKGIVLENWVQRDQDVGSLLFCVNDREFVRELDVNTSLVQDLYELDGEYLEE